LAINGSFVCNIILFVVKIVVLAQTGYGKTQKTSTLLWTFLTGDVSAIYPRPRRGMRPIQRPCLSDVDWRMQSDA